VADIEEELRQMQEAEAPIRKAPKGEQPELF
jgi:hypothetical protein